MMHGISVIEQQKYILRIETPWGMEVGAITLLSIFETTFDKIVQYNLDGSNTDGSFTVNDSNSFLSPQEILPIAEENKYFGILMEIFIVYHENVCCVYSLESPHRGDSNEYTPYTIIL